MKEKLKALEEVKIYTFWVVSLCISSETYL